MFCSNPDTDRFQASPRQGQGPYVLADRSLHACCADILSERELIPTTGRLLPLASGPRPYQVPGKCPEAGQDSCQQSSGEGRSLGRCYARVCLCVCVCLSPLAAAPHSSLSLLFSQSPSQLGIRGRQAHCEQAICSRPQLPKQKRAGRWPAATQSGKGGLVTLPSSGGLWYQAGPQEVPLEFTGSQDAST